MSSRSKDANTGAASGDADTTTRRVAHVDALIRQVARQLRRAGVQLPEAHLHHVAEEVILDATRFVLDWVESPVEREGEVAA